MEGLSDNQGAEVEGRGKYNTPYEKLTSIREFAMVTKLLLFDLPRKPGCCLINKLFDYNICMAKKIFCDSGTFLDKRNLFQNHNCANRSHLSSISAY